MLKRRSAAISFLSILLLAAVACGTAEPAASSTATPTQASSAATATPTQGSPVRPATAAPGSSIATSTPAQGPQTPTPSPTPVRTMVWPSLESVNPLVALRGFEVMVSGRGGYIQFNGGFDESARNFELYFDGELVGSNFTCFVNRCEGSFKVPAEASIGLHEVSVEGGSKLRIEVR